MIIIRIHLHRLITISLLMIVLVGCGNASPGKSTQSHPSTPTATRTPTPTPTTMAAQNADWTTYHGNNARTGYVANMTDPHKLTRAWKARLDGSVYGSPLVVGGPLIVVTEAGSLFSLDMHTGQGVWPTSRRQPVALSTL